MAPPIMSLYATFASIFVLPLAYLDPVTGSFIVQAAIGLLLGGWYLVKRYYNRMRTYIQGLFAFRSGDE